MRKHLTLELVRRQSDSRAHEGDCRLRPLGASVTIDDARVVVVKERDVLGVPGPQVGDTPPERGMEAPTGPMFEPARDSRPMSHRTFWIVRRRQRMICTDFVPHTVQRLRRSA